VKNHNDPENQYESINSFIRDEFFRQDAELERNDYNNELKGRNSLLDNKSIDALRRLFMDDILKTCEPLYRLQGIRPSVDELLQLSKSSGTFMELPEGLFTLTKTVYTFDKVELVREVMQRLKTTMNNDTRENFYSLTFEALKLKK